MIALRLTREVMTDGGSRGALEILNADGETRSRLFTIEKPFLPSTTGGKAGEAFKSCVSPGTYALSTFVRANGDKVWMLSNPELDVFKLDTDIPAARKDKGRFLILIHIGNRASDVVGCIAPGLSHRRDANGMMVTSSKEAMKTLHKALDGRRNLEIEIIHAEGVLTQVPVVRRATAVTAPIIAAAPAVAAGQTPNMRNWLRVPQGSTFTVKLSGTTTTELVTGSGTIRSDNAPRRNFSDSEVQPGPLNVQLEGKDSCTVMLNLQFGKQATADLVAFVEGPDGAHIHTDYHEQFPRPQGSAESIVFNVFTV